MNTKLFLCIAMGVFVAHLAVLMIYVRVTAKPEPAPVVVKPTFTMAEEVVTGTPGGGKIVNREFTITTRLAPPGTYRGNPDKPVNE